MKNALVEFFGTFFFVLVVGLTVVPPNVGPFAPLAMGAALASLVYAGGRFYNPAVTLALWIRGKYSVKDAVLFLVVQIVAGIVAALVVNYLRAGAFNPATTPIVRDSIKVLVTETLFTFLLVYIILQVATSSKNAGNSYYGIAIGLTVTAISYAGAPVSGADFNPAVAAGAAVTGLIAAADVWLYIGANLVGGALAALVYRVINPDEFAE
jgi:aquaporin Z